MKQREIRKFSKTIPIIAVTAYSFSSDKEKVLENGFNGYVPKPVDVHILKENSIVQSNKTLQQYKRTCQNRIKERKLHELRKQQVR